MNFYQITAALMATIIFDIDGLKLSEEIKTEIFYRKINETLFESMNMYPRRIGCIMKELRSKRAMTGMDETIYEFTYVNNEYLLNFTNKTEVMKVLEPMISSASF